MPRDNKDANRDNQNPSDRRGEGSQDAVRHEKDAQHHKYLKDQESMETDLGEGQQPEIPKVGSRDAPGG